MSVTFDSCDHSIDVLDSNTGDYICTLCGLVLDRYYKSSSESIRPFQISKENDFVEEILSKLNVPSSILHSVVAKLDVKNVKRSEICEVIYSTLIDMGIPFTLKEITSVSGIASKRIQPTSSVTILDEKKILERSCSKLGLSYKDYTLIKKKIKSELSGFNPSTVIAAWIYRYCKENNKKIKLKKITEIVGISSMSVHRYLRRNDVS